MVVDAVANRQGLTISEFQLVGGPGFGGCPQGPESMVPNAPVAVSGVRGNASLTAAWAAATTIIDGSPVTSYDVEVQDTVTGIITPSLGVAANLRSVVVGGLTNGTPYNITVRANSLAGQSPVKASFGTVTPSTLPATVSAGPRIGTATAGNASALVRWTKPVNDGGSPVAGYHVRMVDAATGTRVIALRDTAAGATSLNFTGLANGTAVRFQVQARTSLGMGAVSAHSNAVTPATKPGSPKIGAATAGSASALVRWTAGATGGSVITKYHVRVVDGATGTKVIALRDTAGTARSLSFTGLARGTSVRFQVQAVNAKGMGPVSAHSNAVTPR
jgi:hypothetical protein